MEHSSTILCPLESRSETLSYPRLEDMINLKVEIDPLVVRSLIALERQKTSLEAGFPPSVRADSDLYLQGRHIAST